jgi:hypothetical protein
MAHFCEVDENNVVIRVIVVGNDDIKNTNGEEEEAVGQAFCVSLFGGRWLQTSYNNTFRKQMAQTGGSYNEGLDMFISPQTFESWTLNNTTGDWEAPVALPVDDKRYYWNEESLNWVELPDLLGETNVL